MSGRTKKDFYFPYYPDQMLHTENTKRNFVLLVNAHLSSYVARHSWATHVKNLGVPDNLISEGMGHTSVKTTHIYIDFTKCNMLDLINKKLITGKSRKIKGI